MNKHLPWLKVKVPAGTKPWVNDQFLEIIDLRQMHWQQGNKLMFSY